jgi:nucleoside-diphosphate-sugar epimerase
MNKKILVTGGAGYIGSTVVRHLLSNDWNVIVLDNLMHGSYGVNAFFGYERYKFIKGDIRDEDLVKECTKNLDAVVHLAAIVGEGACDKDISLTKSINITGTKNLYNSSIKNKIKNFIFFSTCSSYGIQDTNLLANENSPLNPVSLYAETKIEMENFIKENCDGNLNYTILRPSTVHGPSPRMRFDLILNHLVKDSIKNKKIKVFGPNLWRPLMWVGEVGRVVDLILRSELKLIKNEVFNLGNTDNNFTKSEVAERIKSKLLDNLEVEYEGQDKDLRSYKVDFSKIEEKLKFKLQKSLDLAIDELIFAISNNLFLDPDNKKYRNH